MFQTCLTLIELLSCPALSFKDDAFEDWNLEVGWASLPTKEQRSVQLDNLRRKNSVLDSILPLMFRFNNTIRLAIGSWRWAEFRPGTGATLARGYSKHTQPHMKINSD